MGGRAAQPSSSCALLSSGNVRCWGNNAQGRLGLGHTSNVGDDETPTTQSDVTFGQVDPVDAAVWGERSNKVRFLVRSNALYDLTFWRLERESGAGGCVGVYEMATVSCVGVLTEGELQWQGGDQAAWTNVTGTGQGNAQVVKDGGGATAGTSLIVEYKLGVGWLTPPGSYTGTHRVQVSQP